jgi:probable HAF family extracellular repeat protein
MQDLGTLGGTLCCQETVVANSRGQVASDSTLAGDLVTHPFLWDKGKLIDLGTLGGTNGVVNGINDRGEVVGFAARPGDPGNDGFLWRNGVMTDLGNLGRTSSAWVVNSQGQVIGASRIDSTPGNIRAFLWEKGGPIVDLNALIPQNSPLTLVFAANINERGEIAGLGVPAGCAPPDVMTCGHAYFLIPDGNCDGDCQSRVDQSQAEAELRRATAPTKVEPLEAPVRSPEQFRNMMHQPFGLSGARPTLRD